MDKKELPFGNAYDKNCPTRIILDVIANKWSVLIIGILSTRIIRFGELRRSISGISTKVLTDRLRRLEEMGLVYRQVHSTSPPSVEYSLTQLGNSLFDIVNDLRIWSETNFEQIMAIDKREYKNSV
ncbi:transcriptional regulator [Photobacterium sp. NCIMB 13483]|uniref:winged helix-turn-helix transcriptional regulator n=1 Tax=Photobacterium sp. NCIMB 13483 TaxID=2022103 RepID=UPI000D15E9E4|nr:helix-turn-helix domain-containing protein [Photobacterium sp. NCIMB 13483]PST87326.1 transcriptional regulator [Photobacterium sp. NCIMB 13483]